MKPLAIHTLYFALVAAWFTVSSTATAEPKSQYGGFPPDADGYQAYLDYIHKLEMIKVEAGAELRQAVEAISVEPGIPITPEQEAGLRAWLYDFLVAFSVSGNDSLAAAFYLREGVNNPEGIKKLKKQLESGPSFVDKAMLKTLKAAGVSIPPIPEPIPNAGDTPFAILKAWHKQHLDIKGRDYFLGNVSFLDSKYKVFKLQSEYESYADYAQTHGLLPIGPMYWPPKLSKEIEEGLKTGKQWVAAQFMFIVEEPEEFASFEGAVRHPFFVRLVWSSEQAIWRLVEIVVTNNAPVMFAFKVT